MTLKIEFPNKQTAALAAKAGAKTEITRKQIYDDL
jgi:hypothetical protein